jgi:hypothetical protein
VHGADAGISQLDVAVFPAAENVGVARQFYLLRVLRFVVLPFVG